jgi:GLPGLI family protein
MKFQLRILLASLVFLSCHFSYSQISEGRIIYDISYPGNAFDSAMKNNLPVECTAYFNADKMRMDMSMGAGMAYNVIVDNVLQEVHVLMDMAGSKTDFFMTRKDIEKEEKDKGTYKIIKSDEVNIIAGYNCKKATAELSEGHSYTVWYTNDIKVNNSNWNNQFRDIDGFLMEFTMNQGVLTMAMKARTVVPEKVSPDIFQVPSGYQAVSGEDLKKMMQGK